MDRCPCVDRRNHFIGRIPLRQMSLQIGRDGAGDTAEHLTEAPLVLIATRLLDFLDYPIPN